MNTKEAILALSQSEKIKTGIVWVSQALELPRGLHPPETQGAERVIQALMGMIVHEVHLARKVSPGAAWDRLETPLEKAGVMIRSGVAAESVVHLTQALSQATSIGHEAMTLLKNEGLL